MKIQLALASTSELVVIPGKLAEMKVGSSRIAYVYLDVPNHIELQSLRTPATKRGTGSARAAMVEFLKQTDKAGLDVKLLASPLDRKTRIDKLVAFYASFGFEVTGRGNMAGEPNMLRKHR